MAIHACWILSAWIPKKDRPTPQRLLGKELSVEDFATAEEFNAHVRQMGAVGEADGE